MDKGVVTNMERLERIYVLLNRASTAPGERERRLKWYTEGPEHLPQQRREAGLTQKAAAELIGVSRRAWQQWEAGDRDMHEALFAHWCLMAPWRT